MDELAEWVGIDGRMAGTNLDGDTSYVLYCVGTGVSEGVWAGEVQDSQAISGHSARGSHAQARRPGLSASSASMSPCRRWPTMVRRGGAGLHYGVSRQSWRVDRQDTGVDGGDTGGMLQQPADALMQSRQAVKVISYTLVAGLDWVSSRLEGDG